MRKGQTKGEKGLSKPVRTRLTNAKYEELEKIAARSKGETISSLARKILLEKPINIYIHDESLDLLMEELAAIRFEILKIGLNINQMTKLFHTYSDMGVKTLYAKKGYERYLQLETHIETLLDKMKELAKRWLSE